LTVDIDRVIVDIDKHGRGGAFMSEASVHELRLVLTVDDFEGSVRVALAPPTVTPFGSTNARFELPHGLQLTLFG
jgi:hypothetical protein